MHAFNFMHFVQKSHEIMTNLFPGITMKQVQLSWGKHREAFSPPWCTATVFAVIVIKRAIMKALWNSNEPCLDETKPLRESPITWRDVHKKRVLTQHYGQVTATSGNRK
jgi:hypothetical protein